MTNSPMYLYDILYRGRRVGQTRATSPKKAKTNYWWKACKNGDKFAYTEYKPSDFEAVLAR